MHQGALLRTRIYSLAHDSAHSGSRLCNTQYLQFYVYSCTPTNNINSTGLSLSHSSRLALRSLAPQLKPVLPCRRLNPRRLSCVISKTILKRVAIKTSPSNRESKESLRRLFFLFLLDRAVRLVPPDIHVYIVSMDYLQEDYLPPPPSTSTATAPVPQSQPHRSPTTPAPIHQSNPSYDLQDSTSPISPPSTIETHNPNDPYNGMPPPPPATYATLPDLMTACQTHARTHGYACVTSSNNHKRGIAYVRCDRGGQYANHWNLTPETRTRHNRTRRLVGCTWKARAKRLRSGEWELRMMEDKHSGHGRSGDARAHPSLRKLGGEAIGEARRMFSEGRGPKEVLEILKRWNQSVTAQDVYNLKAKIVREADGGTTRAKGKTIGDGGNVTHIMNGIRGQSGEIVAVDPALQAQSRGLAPAARMQDVTMEDSSAAVLMNGTMESAAPQQKGKCDCKCCDH